MPDTHCPRWYTRNSFSGSIAACVANASPDRNPARTAGFAFRHAARSVTAHPAGAAHSK